MQRIFARRESLESFRIWYVLSLEVGTCENWPRKRVWPSTVGVILSSQRNWRRTHAAYVLCCVEVTDMTKTNAGRSRWDTMELRYLGNVRDVVRMPGNGKSGTGADPGDFLKPRTGLIAAEGRESVRPTPDRDRAAGCGTGDLA